MSATSLLNKEDMNDTLKTIHDCHYEITGNSMHMYDALFTVKKIPGDIMSIAMEWGGYDTEFREKVFEWMKKNNENKN